MKAAVRVILLEGDLPSIAEWLAEYFLDVYEDDAYDAFPDYCRNLRRNFVLVLRAGMGAKRVSGCAVS
ncbi:MAG: hypothetical protein WB817_05370, partial [Terriglobales bacterium]